MGKKKKIKQDRIENDLFEDDKENITKTKKNKSKIATNDIMELAELSGDDEDKDNMEEDEEINVIIDKKSKKKSKPKGGCLNSFK